MAIPEVQGGVVLIETGLATALGTINGYSGRVFPLIAPEAFQLPYATYQLISNDRLKTLSGYTSGLFADYQINFYGTTYSAVKTAANSWISYIKNFTGSMGTVTVQSVEVTNEIDDSDYVGSVIRYRSIVECKFYY